MSRSDHRPPPDSWKDMCEQLAKAAERMAETATDGARIHDQLVGRLPGASEHADRQRRLAAAASAAAVAYRNLEVPPEAVRRAIVESRHSGSSESLHARREYPMHGVRRRCV